MPIQRAQRRLALLLLLLLSMALPVTPTLNRAVAAASPEQLATAIRTIMAADTTPTLISLDIEGRPRARTVQVSAPNADLELWIATRPVTRKVAQIRRDNRVTVHFTDDANGAYVSVMGTATLHDDAETLARQTFHSAAELAAFWPDYPEDYLLLHIRPEWIEVLGAGIEADSATWRPATLEP